jgi:MFS family permease
MSMPPSPSTLLDRPSTGSTAEASEVLLSKPFVLMLCVQFAFGLSYSSFFLLPKYLARVFHANADTIGAVAATALLAGVCAVPLIGAAIDRGSRRRMITFGALVNALSAWGFAAVHTVGAALFVLRAIHGISYALVFNATVTLAADLAPAKKLGQAIGLCGAAGMLANAIAPALGEVIADHQGWGTVFTLGAAAALVAALLSLRIRENAATLTGSAEPRPRAHELAARPTALPSALRFALEPGRVGAFVCSAAAGAGFGVMFTFTQPFALSHGASQVSGFFVGYTACALSVRVFLGSLADTFGRRPIAFASLSLYGLVACMTSLLRPELLFAVGGALGLAHGMLYPALNALAVDGVPRARRGAVMSYFLGCFNLGFALWVMSMGVLAKSHGYPILFLLTGLLVWSSLLILPKKAKGLVT